MGMGKSLFLETFGGTPINRVLDFLVVHQEFDYSMTDIATLAGVGYSTLKMFWPNLERGRLVKSTRVVGKAKMYKLNFENSAVQKFEELYWTVTKRAIREGLSERIAAVR